MATLDDGETVELRAIRADDVDELVAFHEGLSFETVYRRFFAVHPHLGPAEAERFCDADSADRFALVALAGGHIVGVARMERLGASAAEVAFVVADRMQHRGLGRLLALGLVAAARRRGITELVAETLAGNQPMLRLLPDAGFPVAVTVSDGVARISCHLDGDPTAPRPAQSLGR